MRKPETAERMPGGKPPARKPDWNAAKRLLGYMKPYRFTLALVALFILLSAVAGAASSMFLQTLIDDYITPLLAEAHPVYTGLIHALITIGLVYLAGILSNWLSSRLMVKVAQQTLRQIRDDMFEKMQRLPIR